MRLVVDDIALEVGTAPTLRLRPSLRAAFHLEKKYGFQRLFLGLQEAHLEVITDMIAEGASTTPKQVMALFHRRPLAALLSTVIEPLVAFLFKLAGLEPHPEHDADGDGVEGKRVSFAEHHSNLYAIATGWLGWSPSEAWAATPNEIMVAYQGRADMLRAIFGGTNESATDKPDEARLDRDGLARLKRMAAKGPSHAV
ncbi:MAG: phage tail assembly chaperone [Proteobacteria bacterium]|nr:phage tail assembly chaperone [Pseudomonadota bacterium]